MGSRSKIEDTASSHRMFLHGKRSVYVHEKVSTGIAKLNADYLGATQRWAEGAVQLFWIHFFIDREKKLIALLVFIVSLYVYLFFALYWPATMWPWIFCAPGPTRQQLPFRLFHRV